MNTETRQIYRIVDGITVLAESIIVEVPTNEEIIAEKEAEMLAMYQEIQLLKQK